MRPALSYNATHTSQQCDPHFCTARPFNSLAFCYYFGFSCDPRCCYLTSLANRTFAQCNPHCPPIRPTLLHSATLQFASIFFLFRFHLRPTLLLFNCTCNSHNATRTFSQCNPHVHTSRSFDLLAFVPISISFATCAAFNELHLRPSRSPAATRNCPHRDPHFCTVRFLKLFTF